MTKKTISQFLLWTKNPWHLSFLSPYHQGFSWEFPESSELSKSVQSQLWYKILKCKDIRKTYKRFKQKIVSSFFPKVHFNKNEASYQFQTSHPLYRIKEKVQHRVIRSRWYFAVRQCWTVSLVSSFISSGIVILLNLCIYCNLGNERH